MKISDSIEKSNLYIGVSSISDPALKKYIVKNGSKRESKCDLFGYCEEMIEKEVLFRHIEKIMGNHYEDGENCLPYESSWIESEEDHELFNVMNGLVAPKNRNLYSTEELVSELEIFSDDKLMEEFVDWLGDKTWCETDPFGLYISEELELAWKEYCDSAQKEDRPTLMWKLAQKCAKDSENGLGNIMIELQGMVLNKGMFKIIPAGTKLYRSRNYNAESVTEFKDISAPPASCVTFPNRMSRAYESLFYAALDEKTCIEEAQDSDKLHTALGVFSNKVDLNLLEFSVVPFNRSIFDPLYDDVLNFLQIFSREISKPISSATAIEEYRPTQILVEYFRYGFSLISKNKIDGMVYRSSKVAGGKNCVLFYDDKDCEKILNLNNIIYIK